MALGEPGIEPTLTSLEKPEKVCPLNVPFSNLLEWISGEE